MWWMRGMRLCLRRVFSIRCGMMGGDRSSAVLHVVSRVETNGTTDRIESLYGTDEVLAHRRLFYFSVSQNVLSHPNLQYFPRLQAVLLEWDRVWVQCLFVKPREITES
jgi:hypothetical protein